MLCSIREKNFYLRNGKEIKKGVIYVPRLLKGGAHSKCSLTYARYRKEEDIYSMFRRLENGSREK